MSNCQCENCNPPNKQPQQQQQRPTSQRPTIGGFVAFNRQRMAANRANPSRNQNQQRDPQNNHQRNAPHNGRSDGHSNREPQDNGQSSNSKEIPPHVADRIMEIQNKGNGFAGFAPPIDEWY